LFNEYEIFLDENEYEIKVKTSESLLKNSNNELSDIIDMILKMAFETEEKKLNSILTKIAVEKLLIYPVYGHYFLINDVAKDKFCGMNLVTFEHNINLDSTILWIQSVFVHEDYRMKGLFRRLLYKNEDFVLEHPSFKKTVKLYMDKDNFKAEKVYFKVGFKICKEKLYELDYHYDDISELKNENSKISKDFNVKILGVKTEKINNLNTHDSHGGIFPDNFYDFVVDVNNNENAEVYCLFGNETQIDDWKFESLINSNKIQMKNEKEKLMKVIRNRNLGAVLLLTNVKFYSIYVDF